MIRGRKNIRVLRILFSLAVCFTTKLAREKGENRGYREKSLFVEGTLMMVALTANSKLFT